MNLPKVFIFSYNRPEFCFSLKAPAIQSFEKFLVVHSKEEAARYQDVADKANAKIIVSGVRAGWPGNGKVRQQKAIYESLSDGEWAIFMDDDIINFRSVKTEYYWAGEPIPKINRRRGYAEIWSHTPSSKDGKKMLLEMIELCESEGSGYCGLHSGAAFSTLQTDPEWINGINSYFIKGWERSKWHWGRHPMAMQIIRRDRRIQLDENIELDDVDLWAKCLLIYGKVLTSQWLLLDSPLYGEMPGGLQSEGKIKRVENRADACERIIKKYPGLFKPGRWLDVDYLTALDFTSSNDLQVRWRSKYIKENNFNPDTDVAP